MDKNGAQNLGRAKHPRALAISAKSMPGAGIAGSGATKNQDFILVFRSKLSIIDQ